MLGIFLSTRLESKWAKDGFVEDKLQSSCVVCCSHFVWACPQIRKRMIDRNDGVFFYFVFMSLERLCQRISQQPFLRNQHQSASSTQGKKSNKHQTQENFDVKASA
jgi:hypothetical protein